MNKALSLCSGEFICFLNAGDTFYNVNILSRIAEAIRQNPGVDFFYGDVYYEGSVRPYSLQPSRLKSFTLFRGTVCHQAWFLRSDVYRNLNGLDTRLKYKADYDFLLRMVHFLKVPYKHLPLCIASYMAGGYSEKTFIESRQEFEYVRRKYIMPLQAWFYSCMLYLLDPIRRNIYYQRLMADIYHWKARRSWMAPKGR